MGGAIAVFATENPLIVMAICVPAWTALHKLAGVLSKQGGPTSVTTAFAALSDDNKQEWCNRIVSSIHAIFVALVTLVFLATAPWPRDPMSGRTSSLDYMWLASLAYTVYDLVHWYQLRHHYDRTILLHHMFMVLGIYYEVSTNYVPYIASLCLVSESSTPCVNLRWILRSMNAKGTIVALNNAALVLLFLGGRIVPTVLALVLQLNMVVRHGDVMNFTERWVYTAVIAVFVSLNLWWYRIIATKAYRLITGQTQPDAAASSPRRGSGDDADAGAPTDADAETAQLLEAGATRRERRASSTGGAGEAGALEPAPHGSPTMGRRPSLSEILIESVGDDDVVTSV